MWHSVFVGEMVGGGFGGEDEINGTGDGDQGRQGSEMDLMDEEGDGVRLDFPGIVLLGVAGDLWQTF